MLEGGSDVLSISRSMPKTKGEKKVMHLNLDFSEPPQTDFFEKLKSSISPYSEVIFINNAFTIEPIEKFGRMKSFDIQKALLVNVITPTMLINKTLHFCSDKTLKVINISSGAAKTPIESWSIYSASKAYINMLILSIDNDYENHKGLTALNFEPGVIDTSMQEKIRNSKSEKANIFSDLKTQNKLRSTDSVALDVIYHINH